MGSSGVKALRLSQGLPGAMVHTRGDQLALGSELAALTRSFPGQERACIHDSSPGREANSLNPTAMHGCVAGMWGRGYVIGAWLCLVWQHRGGRMGAWVCGGNGGCTTALSGTGKRVQYVEVEKLPSDKKPNDNWLHVARRTVFFCVLCQRSQSELKRMRSPHRRVELQQRQRSSGLTHIALYPYQSISMPTSTLCPCRCACLCPQPLAEPHAKTYPCSSSRIIHPWEPRQMRSTQSRSNLLSPAAGTPALLASPRRLSCLAVGRGRQSPRRGQTFV